MNTNALLNALHGHITVHHGLNAPHTITFDRDTLGGYIQCYTASGDLDRWRNTLTDTSTRTEPAETHGLHYTRTSLAGKLPATGHRILLSSSVLHAGREAPA